MRGRSECEGVAHLGLKPLSKAERNTRRKRMKRSYYYLHNENWKVGGNKSQRTMKEESWTLRWDLDILVKV